MLASLEAAPQGPEVAGAEILGHSAAARILNFESRMRCPCRPTPRGTRRKQLRGSSFVRVRLSALGSARRKVSMFGLFKP